MAEDLQLRLAGRPSPVQLTAAGALHADNAHRLPKFLVSLLRTRRVGAVRLDLRAVRRIDDVGVAAVVLCGREAARRGIPFTLDGCSRVVAASLRAYGAGHLLPARPRRGMPLRAPHTGTVCPGAAPDGCGFSGRAGGGSRRAACGTAVTSAPRR